MGGVGVIDVQEVTLVTGEKTGLVEIVVDRDGHRSTQVVERDDFWDFVIDIKSGKYDRFV